MRIRTARWLAAAAAGTLLGALSISAATAATTVAAGIDVWHTPAGGAAIDFGAVDGTTTLDDEPAVPAGFFCGGSAAYTGRILLGGFPIVTSPAGAVGTGDTIVRRLSSVLVPDTGSVPLAVRIEALNLQRTGGATISRCGESWTLRAHLSNLVSQTNGDMTLFGTTAHTGGTFTTSFTVKARFEFEGLTSGTKKNLYPTTPLTVRTKAGQVGHFASPTFCPGAVQVSSSFTADTTGDGVPDTVLPGTGNANFGCQCQDLTCGTVAVAATPHEGPHPNVTPDPSDEEECGAGPGLALLLPVLLALHERRRRARA